MKWLISFTKDKLSNLFGVYMSFPNVHTTVMLYENTEYCKIRNGSVLAIPDGAPFSVNWTKTWV